MLERLLLTLEDALVRAAGAKAPDSRRHPVAVEIRFHAGGWPKAVEALAVTFNAARHLGRITASADRVSLHIGIRPDPWVPGGELVAEVTPPPTVGANGRWSGTWCGEAVSGTWRAEAVAESQPLFPAQTSRLLATWEESPRHAALPDCSYAGRGCAAIEPGSSGPVFRAEDFGVRPDSGQDGTRAVQAAVDAASAAGGGIVLLPAGRIDFNLDDPTACVQIAASRVVLRGAGSRPGGTTLFSHRPGRSPDLAKPWLAGLQTRCVKIAAPDTTESFAAFCGPVPRGALRLPVLPGHGLRPGDTLVLVQREDAAGSLGQALTAPAGRLAANWRGEGRQLVRQLVTVVATQDDVIELDQPVRWPCEVRWRPELRRRKMLHGVGVENLRFATAWSGFFEHHFDDVHDNGWDPLHLSGCHDSWITGCVFDSVTTAVGMSDCTRCTLADNRITGNPGHNGFGMGGASSANLILRCHAGRQMHALAMQSTPSGNVVADCSCDEPAGLDNHGVIGTDNLVEGLIGAVFTGGGSQDAVPPRSGRGMVLWNWEQGTFNPYRPERPLTCLTRWDELPGILCAGVRRRDGLLPTWFGPEGEGSGDVDAPWAVIEASGRAVTPRSLWRHQLERRLGSLPAWIG